MKIQLSSKQIPGEFFFPSFTFSISLSLSVFWFQVFRFQFDDVFVLCDSLCHLLEGKIQILFPAFACSTTPPTTAAPADMPSSPFVGGLNLILLPASIRPLIPVPTTVAHFTGFRGSLFLLHRVSTHTHTHTHQQGWKEVKIKSKAEQIKRHAAEPAPPSPEGMNPGCQGKRFQHTSDREVARKGDFFFCCNSSSLLFRSRIRRGFSRPDWKFLFSFLFFLFFFFLHSFFNSLMNRILRRWKPKFD